MEISNMCQYIPSRRSLVIVLSESLKLRDVSKRPLSHDYALPWSKFTTGLSLHIPGTSKIPRARKSFLGSRRIPRQSPPRIHTPTPHHAPSRIFNPKLAGKVPPLGVHSSPQPHQRTVQVPVRQMLLATAGPEDQVSIRRKQAIPTLREPRPVVLGQPAIFAVFLDALA